VAEGRRSVAATARAALDRLGHEREERGGKERRERTKKGCAPVQIRASRANRAVVS
jgi:hypothetical protein